DCDPALVLLSLELLPAAIPFLGDGITRSWRGSYRGRRLRVIGTEGDRLREWGRRRRRQSHRRLLGLRLLVLGQATFLVFLTAATRTGIVATGFHGSHS